MSLSWTAFAADMIGGVFAGLTAMHLYGDHAKWIDPLMPWGDKHHDKSVSKHTQVCGTTTHSLSHLLFARSLTQSRTMTRVSAAILRYVVHSWSLTSLLTHWLAHSLTHPSTHLYSCVHVMCYLSKSTQFTCLLTCYGSPVINLVLCIFLCLCNPSPTMINQSSARRSQMIVLAG